MKVTKIAVRLAVAAAVVFVAGQATSLVLVEKSPEQKQRKDVDKQTAKLALCLGKSLLKCEENGASDAPECDIQNPGASTVPDPDNKIIPKFIADIAKCESKLNLAKKGNFYTEIGCPGDSDSMTAGDQPYANLAAYQASVPAATKVQLALLAGILTALCPDNQCTVDQGKLGLKYAKAVFKCISKCENDYKNKKGDGGIDDLTTKCEPGGGDANFSACISKGLTKAAGIDMAFAGGLGTAISDGRDDLYNEDDCP